MNNGIDILAIGAHPDDVELGCGGTLIQQAKLGRKTVVCDLTAGEMGTRGTVEGRRNESRMASELLGLWARIQLHLPDSRLELSAQHLDPIIAVIRHFKPKVVLCNAPKDRHPDHGIAAQLAVSACFKAGLAKYELNQLTQPTWIYHLNETPEQFQINEMPYRPDRVYHYIQAYSLEPDFIVDVADFHDQKMKAVLAHRSQFFDPNSKEPETLISSPAFLELLAARSIHLGVPNGIRMAEGFLVNRPPVVRDLMQLH